LRRFIIPPHAVDADQVTITGDLFHHMAHVLRLKTGARICLTDGSGREYTGIISRVAEESISVTLEETREAHATECGPRITLFQGIPKGDKLELILQKCTELGVDGIVPFMACRSVARVPAGRLKEKLERWQRIVREAARQSNRSSVPDVSFARDLAEVLRLAEGSVKLLLWEEESAGTLKKVLAKFALPERVAVIVGPEGGLTAEEVASAVKSGFIPVSLGRRIVRTETAGLAIVAILQFYWGDLG
jgi:16S rRNA (uracil1498-N3)-methyltransferase